MTHLQQLLKGMVDPILLSLISELPTYGYQIVKELEKRGSRPAPFIPRWGGWRKPV